MTLTYTEQSEWLEIEQLNLIMYVIYYRAQSGIFGQ